MRAAIHDNVRFARWKPWPQWLWLGFFPDAKNVTFKKSTQGYVKSNVRIMIRMVNISVPRTGERTDAIAFSNNHAETSQAIELRIS